MISFNGYHAASASERRGSRSCIASASRSAGKKTGMDSVLCLDISLCLDEQTALNSSLAYTTCSLEDFKRPNALLKRLGIRVLKKPKQVAEKSRKKPSPR